MPTSSIIYIDMHSKLDIRNVPFLSSSFRKLKSHILRKYLSIKKYLSGTSGSEVHVFVLPIELKGLLAVPRNRIVLGIVR